MHLWIFALIFQAMRVCTFAQRICKPELKRNWMESLECFEWIDSNSFRNMKPLLSNKCITESKVSAVPDCTIFMGNRRNMNFPCWFLDSSLDTKRSNTNRLKIQRKINQDLKSNLPSEKWIVRLWKCSPSHHPAFLQTNYIQWNI